MTSFLLKGGGGLSRDDGPWQRGEGVKIADFRMTSFVNGILFQTGQKFLSFVEYFVLLIKANYDLECSTIPVYELTRNDKIKNSFYSNSIASMNS